MDISVQHRNDGVTVEVSGRMVYGEPVNELQTRIQQLVDDGAESVVVNLDNVSHLDSSGVEALLGAHATCSAVPGGLRLINVYGKARTVLHITKLESLFGLSVD